MRQMRSFRILTSIPDLLHIYMAHTKYSAGPPPTQLARGHSLAAYYTIWNQLGQCPGHKGYFSEFPDHEKGRCDDLMVSALASGLSVRVLSELAEVIVLCSWAIYLTLPVSLHPGV